MPIKDENPIYGRALGKSLQGIPDRPDSLEHLRALSAIVRKAAERVADRSDLGFREDLGVIANTCGDLLSEMMQAEQSGDMVKFRSVGPKLSRSLSNIYKMCDEGAESIKAETAFAKLVTVLLQRVEAYEDMNTKRVALLSSSSVISMMNRFAEILNDYLPAKRAQAAFRELRDGYEKMETLDI